MISKPFLVVLKHELHNASSFLKKVMTLTKYINTRKYPLRGYFLGVLTHTTAWDRLWGGDVFLRLYIRSSASPRIAAVGLGCWNCEHVILRVAI